jgi:hypothetical protein
MYHVIKASVNGVIKIAAVSEFVLWQKEGG